MIPNAKLVAALAPLLLLTACGPPRADRIVIGSKNFTEQLVLGEIMAQQIENKTHLPVERRFYLAGSYICQQAILGGRIDIYPEYTGTALTAILKAAAFQQSPNRSTTRSSPNTPKQFNLEVGTDLWVQQHFRHRNPRRRRPPSRPENNLASGSLHSAMARRLWLRIHGTPRRLQRTGRNLRPSLRRIPAHHGPWPAGARAHRQTNRSGRRKHDRWTDPGARLFVLEDDRHYFPPYEAVPIIRQDMLARHPGVAPALHELAGKISDEDMRQLNYAIDGQHRDVKEVVGEFLRRKAFVRVSLRHLASLWLALRRRLATRGHDGTRRKITSTTPRPHPQSPANAESSAGPHTPASS